MKTKTIIIYFVLLTLGASTILSAQQQVQLEQVLGTVINNSYAVQTARNQKNIAEASYKFYKSQLKPNVGLRASLPDYSKTSAPVIQPDGTISFTSIRQANSTASLFATQLIPSTGGTIFFNSDIQRFDDFSLDDRQFNGSPVRLGISQPLFGFNPWKYLGNIENLRKEESLLEYNISIEEALGTATELYFNILIAKQNLEIAKTNQLVNEKLLVITEERLFLGKVSRDEKLQLEIELNNAKLNVSQAGLQVQQTIASLFTYLSAQLPENEAAFAVPDIAKETKIDLTALLQQYKQNRPEILAYQRAKRETDMDLAQAKSDFGLQADLQASIGLARGAENLKEVYTDPFNEQQFNIALQIPILDWGKRKSAMKQVEIRAQDLEAGFKQQVLQLENEIVQRVYQFERLQSDITLLQEIMEKAQERFTISNERYVLGNIEITNLTLAQREKDQAKRNYVNALKDYWVTYYELRALSGYDILNNQKIIYQ